MGALLTLMRNTINFVKRFNDTVSGMRQNIANIRKCSKDIAGIVHDLKCISHEVKDAVKNCSSEIQAKMCAAIYDRLPVEDLESIRHVLFYKGFLKRVEKMRKIDGEIATGDLLTYLKEETCTEVRKHRDRFQVGDGQYRLLFEMEKLLELSTNCEFDSVSCSDENSTLMTDLCDTKDEDDALANEQMAKDSEEWVSMDVLGKDKGKQKQYDRERKRNNDWKSFLINICKWRKKNTSDGTSSNKCKRIFCALNTEKNDLSRMITEYLSKSSVAVAPPASGVIIKSIIEGENIYETENYTYSPCMAKINAQLERVIRRHDLTKLNLKVKLNTDVNLKEALEILDSAAKRVNSARDEIIGNTKNTKDVLITDIQSFNINDPLEEKNGRTCLDLMPFKNTLTMLKEKSSKTIENNMETILKKSSLINGTEIENLIRLADVVFDEAELMIRPAKLLQKAFAKEDKHILPVIFSIFSGHEDKKNEKIFHLEDKLENLLRQLTKRHPLTSLERGEETSRSSESTKMLSTVTKMSDAIINDEDLHDTLIQILLTENQDFGTVLDNMMIPDKAVSFFMEKIIKNNGSTLPETVSRVICEEVFSAMGINSKWELSLDDSLEILCKCIDRAMKGNVLDTQNVKKLQGIVLEKLVLRVLS